MRKPICKAEATYVCPCHKHRDKFAKKQAAKARRRFNKALAKAFLIRDKLILKSFTVERAA